MRSRDHPPPAHACETREDTLLLCAMPGWCLRAAAAAMSGRGVLVLRDCRSLVSSTIWCSEALHPVRRLPTCGEPVHR